MSHLPLLYRLPLLRLRQCPYCRARIVYLDNDGLDDDQFKMFACKQGHPVYVPRPQFQSAIIRLYVEGFTALYQDVLIDGKWRRAAIHADLYLVVNGLMRKGYQSVLSPSNFYLYFRRLPDEERRLEAGRVHWEEQKLRESSLMMG